MAQVPFPNSENHLHEYLEVVIDIAPEESLSGG